MGRLTLGPEPSGRGRGALGLGRFVPRGLLTPDFCLVLGVLLVGVVALSFSGQGEAEEERAAHDEIGFHGSPVEGVAISPDGNRVASASRDGTVIVWDLRSGRSCRVLTRNAIGFSSVAFSPDGSALAAGGLACGVTLFDPISGRTLGSFGEADIAIRHVTFSPDGKSLAAGGDDGVVRIWDVTSRQLQAELRGHAGIVMDLEYSPDGRSLASAAVTGEAIIWDLSTGRAGERFEVNIRALSSLAFTSDGRLLALGGVGAITICEVATGRSRNWSTPQGRVTSLQFLPDGQGLASSGLDGSIAFWSGACSEEKTPPQRTLTYLGHKGGIKAIAISSDGAILISGGNDDAVRIRDLPPTAERAEATLSKGQEKTKTI